MKKILIIDDEAKLRNELKLFLENNGYTVDIITTFNNTLNYMLQSDANLILLDINLPYINGQTLCKEFRLTKDTPLIILTSKDTEIDEIISINYGADDFITKPFSPQILLARIERLIKRDILNLITYDKLILDITKSIMYTEKATIDLTKNENKILYYLLKNKGVIISRDDLMDYLWDNNEFVDDNTLTVNINRLRGKLEQIGYKDIIITKRSQGYIILRN